MDFWFNQLSRMNYGKECIESSKKANPHFVDSITFGINGCNSEQYLSEAQIVWLQLRDNEPPYPHIEVFSDGIIAAYSNEFIKAIMMLKEKGDFTPEECTKTLISCGFTDTSENKTVAEITKKENKFNLRTALENFFIAQGYECYIEEPWIEDGVLQIQNSGPKSELMHDVNPSLVSIYRFAQEHAYPFISPLGAISEKVVLGIDGIEGKELTGTWQYSVKMTDTSNEEKMFNAIKKAFEAKKLATIVVEPDYRSYNNGSFTLKIKEVTPATISNNDYEVTEWCSNCETENTIVCNPKKDGYISVCKTCNRIMILCSECTRDNCDWSEMGCRMCTPYDFLMFLANRYKGEINQNSYGEYSVCIPLSSGRFINITHETEGLEKSEFYYDIRVMCSSAEAETEQYKDNPTVFTNSYKNIQNVFLMVSTLFDN